MIVLHKNSLEEENTKTITTEHLSDGAVFAFSSRPRDIYILTNLASQVVELETGDIIPLTDNDYYRPIDLIEGHFVITGKK